MEDVPSVILQQIFSYLPADALLVSQLVCFRWKHVQEENDFQFFKTLAIQLYNEPPDMHRGIEWKRALIQRHNGVSGITFRQYVNDCGKAVRFDRSKFHLYENKVVRWRGFMQQRYPSKHYFTLTVYPTEGVYSDVSIVYPSHMVIDYPMGTHVVITARLKSQGTAVLYNHLLELIKIARVDEVETIISDIPFETIAALIRETHVPIYKELYQGKLVQWNGRVVGYEKDRLFVQCKAEKPVVNLVNDESLKSLEEYFENCVTGDMIEFIGRLAEYPLLIHCKKIEFTKFATVFRAICRPLKLPFVCTSIVIIIWITKWHKPIAKILIPVLQYIVLSTGIVIPVLYTIYKKYDFRVALISLIIISTFIAGSKYFKIHQKMAYGLLFCGGAYAVFVNWKRILGAVTMIKFRKSKIKR